MAEHAIRRATPDDAAALTDVLARAFLDDPISTWLFADRAERERLHPAFFGPFLTLVLEAGQVWTTDDLAGATLWLDVDPAESGEDDGGLSAAIRAGIGDRLADRFAIIDDLMTRNHPHDRAHAYLPFIAVRPDAQDTGVGSALLRHRFVELDADRRPAYLEASSPRNQVLYERLGFKPMAVSLDLPGGPSLQPMWREPAGI
jgi:ribosomal protein S18 acetylase RimI-like enzyme